MSKFSAGTALFAEAEFIYNTNEKLASKKLAALRALVLEITEFSKLNESNIQRIQNALNMAETSSKENEFISLNDATLNLVVKKASVYWPLLSAKLSMAKEWLSLKDFSFTHAASNYLDLSEDKLFRLQFELQEEYKDNQECLNGWKIKPWVAISLGVAAIILLGTMFATIAVKIPSPATLLMAIAVPILLTLITASYLLVEFVEKCNAQKQNKKIDNMKGSSLNAKLKNAATKQSDKEHAKASNQNALFQYANGVDKMPADSGNKSGLNKVKYIAENAHKFKFLNNAVSNNDPSSIQIDISPIYTHPISERSVNSG